MCLLKIALSFSRKHADRTKGKGRIWGQIFQHLAIAQNKTRPIITCKCGQSFALLCSMTYMHQRSFGSCFENKTEQPVHSQFLCKRLCCRYNRLHSFWVWE